MRRVVVAVVGMTLLAACSRQDAAQSVAAAQQPAAPAAPAVSTEESSVVTHDLVGTRWALVKLGEQPVAPEPDGKEPFLALQSDAHATGHGGCNRIMGPYELEGEQLSFTQMASTRMACPDMRLEDAFLEALKTTASYRITGDQLELFDTSGTPVVTFAARNL